MKRNYGIDLLRIVSMLMIVTTHILGHGGILEAVPPLSASYWAVWLIEGTAFCAVNCYALISGYVQYGRKYRLSSFLQTYLQALLYSVGIAVCVWIVNPELFSLGNLLAFSLPISMRRYWYFSAYAGLFLIIPLLNAGITALSEQKAKILLFAIFVMFTVMPTLSGFDPFASSYGYGTFWLAIMYLVGGCFRKFGWGDHLPIWKSLFVFIASALVSWGWKVGVDAATLSLLGETKSIFELISNISPTMVIAAAALFLTFKNLHIPSRLTALISTFSPACFGVYLIHDHRYIRELIITDAFVSWAKFDTLSLVLLILGTALAIFTVCLLIDFLRCKLFHWMQVKGQLEKAENWLISRFLSEDI